MLASCSHVVAKTSVLAPDDLRYCRTRVEPHTAGHGTTAPPTSLRCILRGGEAMTAGVPLLLVDGHNLLFRACYGTPARIMSRDQDGKRDLTTQFMFFALLRKGINDEFSSWPEVVVVFDGQDGATHRQDTDPGYKATRPATEEALRPILALPDVKSGLTMHGITWIEIDDAEADDVIATLATADPAREVLIASMDQDYYQLLRDPTPGCGGVRVFNTARRPGHRFIGTAQMTARYNVTPRTFPDLRALCGDSSDNIPGVKGIGAKTAATLLSGGLTLDDLPTSGRLTGSKGTAIIAAWKQVLTWRSMIRMRTDLPLPDWPSGTATVPMPIPGEVIAALGLWRRPG
jgi:DNA polymerase-1